MGECTIPPQGKSSKNARRLGPARIGPEGFVILLFVFWIELLFVIVILIIRVWSEGEITRVPVETGSGEVDGSVRIVKDFHGSPVFDDGGDQGAQGEI